MPSNDATTTQAQMMGQKYGFDWQKFANFLSKLEPALQEIVLTIIDELQGHDVPTLVGAAPNENEIAPVAEKYGMTPAELTEIFKMLSPVVMKLLLAVLKKSK